MQVVDRRPVYFDVDDTLILWNRSEYRDLPVVFVDHVKGPVELAINQKNVNMLVRLAKAGRYVIVHSGNGHRWAETIVKALGIEPFVDQVMDKALDIYVDDTPAHIWSGSRIWRDPKTGESKS